MSDKSNIKKKRGRKPKNNIIVNKNPVFNSKTGDNVVKLKKNPKEEFDINSFNNVSDMHGEVDTSFNKSEICWNCCHKFDNFIFGIPIKYDKTIFYTYGDFCSIGCALRYIYDNYNGNQFREIYSNTMFYKNMIYGEDKDISIAPNKLCLSIFGGNLDIDEYRKASEENKCYDIQRPNIIQLQNTFKNNSVAKLETENDLVLYRKKPLCNKNNNIKHYININ